MPARRLRAGVCRFHRAAVRPRSLPARCVQSPVGRWPARCDWGTRRRSASMHTAVPCVRIPASGRRSRALRTSTSTSDLRSASVIRECRLRVVDSTPGMPIRDRKPFTSTSSRRCASVTRPSIAAGSAWSSRARRTWSSADHQGPVVAADLPAAAGPRARARGSGSGGNAGGAGGAGGMGRGMRAAVSVPAGRARPLAPAPPQNRSRTASRRGSSPRRSTAAPYRQGPGRRGAVGLPGEVRQLPRPAVSAPPRRGRGPALW